MRPDDELIASILSGDTESFAELVRRYQRTACAVAAGVLGDRHLAEDAAQEAFVAAFQNLSDLKNRAAFPAWLIRIARRQALRLVGRHVSEASLVQFEELAAPPANGRLDEKTTELLNCVMRLPEHEQTVILLHHMDGHDVHAVARMTGRPLGTVTKQLSRAYERLRKNMKEAPRS